MNALVFSFVADDAVIDCAHCQQRIDVSDGKPMPFWNNAPLHRHCADAYISVQGWEPAVMPGINIYRRAWIRVMGGQAATNRNPRQVN